MSAYSSRRTTAPAPHQFMVINAAPVEFPPCQDSFVFLFFSQYLFFFLQMLSRVRGWLVRYWKKGAIIQHLFQL